MIIEQNPYVDKNGKVHTNLVRHYSDRDVYIRQIETGLEYVDAVDVIPCRYTYEETNEMIEEFTTEISDSEALAIILGGIE
jgi:hypothetical protein